jgi:nicotinate-nucleotide adenylyltransferase
VTLRYELPAARPGQAIGLLGGSFDPPHPGHLHISREALKRFGLNGVWWLVSPGNPLKARGPAPLDRRIKASRALVDDPRIEVTGIESHIGTHYTAQTISAIQKLYPRTHFVWLMGADNLAQFHRWESWQQIIERVPIGVLARPGGRIPARTSKAAQLYRSYRVRKRDAFGLAYKDAPAWSFVNVPMRNDSSSAIRARGAW